MTSQHKLALVTVGTTKFDALIEGVDNESLLKCLLEHGFTDLLVQQGKGAYRINKIHPSPNAALKVR